MHYFDYSFLKNITLPVNFLQMTNTIYYLKGKSERNKKDYPEIFTNLQKIAIIQSVKSSNEIEGIVTTDKRIQQIVNDSSAPLNHNEQEIAGYRDALNFINTKCDDIHFDVESILHLHYILTNKTDLKNKGVFKDEDNIILEKHIDGSTQVRFRPVSSEETPNAVLQLIYAYIEARDDSSINQLLLIPCFILDFLCIHPFSDGNGRISRLLTLLLLYKNGFDIPKFISFEQQINNSKQFYYESLKQSSINWHENKNDYIPFINNFLYTLFLCYKELDKRFLTLKDGKISKSKRVENVVLSSIVPISKKEISLLLIDVSITTIEKVLSDLLKDKKIKKIGSTNNAVYIKI